MSVIPPVTSPATRAVPVSDGLLVVGGSLLSVTPINQKARSPMNANSDDIVDNPDSWVAEHIRDYVATDGRRGHRLSGWKASTLLLVTRGRRSGVLRRTALAYGEHDGNYVVVASNGGAERPPGWYLNLMADPVVRVQVRDDRFTARARVADADERPGLWKLMTSLSPSLDDYQQASGREIPVVILERI
jgi:deazaflavin-dependent oxidoreductase (nitroreductase family)